MRAKKIIVVASAVALAAIGTVILLTAASGPKSASLDAREQAMETLGASIAKLNPKCKVLVLGNPFAKSAGYLHETSKYDRTGLRGLRKGLGRDIPVTEVLPEIRPEYYTDRQSLILLPDCRTPLSFAIRPDSVDQLAEAHPECRVIVSLIGLPAGVDQLKIWDDKDPRSFALLLPDLRILGDKAATVEAFQRGKLLAALGQDPASGQTVVVTRENAQAVLERQPKVLGY